MEYAGFIAKGRDNINSGWISDNYYYYYLLTNMNCECYARSSSIKIKSSAHRDAAE